MAAPSYRRLLTEAVVIVASILLAFGVDAWWDERQEDQAAAELAEGLLGDVRASLANLEDTRHRNTVKREASVLAREYLRSSTPVVSLDSLTTLLYQSGGTARLTPVLRSYDQLVSTGLMRRLDPAIQTAVAEWIQQQEIARDYFERDLLDFRQNVGFPFWARSPVAFDQMLADHSEAVPFGAPRFPHDWGTLHESSELADILAIFAIMTQSAVDVYDRTEVEARELEALLVARYGQP